MEKLDRLLRKAEVLKARGKGHTLHFRDIRAGLFTHPISIGKRAVAWPESEVAAINKATIAGKGADDIRALVKDLEARRVVAA